MVNLQRDKKYIEWVHNLKEKFRQVQLKAAVKVNNGKKKQNGEINF